ncbi:probable serine/threonine-protein kinase kinX [Halichondria panicea]|uniref:probable serine/threonine-protein kinase kinX n=1 Tax=Halichondria panicea TaxID=6063 RepID=UPI00312BCB9F
MAERQDNEQEYIFRNVQLFKNDTLGTGSYGVVCKAKCDQLLCAAKLLYPVLFQIAIPDPGKEHRHPFRRFETECAFLSRINHPNIVQYLGTYRDPDTNAPVLLMELMDESLTHFLESSPGHIPYHIQVNLSYDIAQALAFLHSNEIIHRDLSSNNVLLIAGTRAKVTDFGMSKFRDINVTRLATMTTCPGTPAFMSPEALNEPPVYTEKLDNFSFGVLLVQTITRQFPNPTDPFKSRELVDPQFPNQAIQANVPVPEIERRQAHISLIEPTHPLLPIARHCLKDRDVERPSSRQLCQTLDALKKTARYQESSQQGLHQIIKEKDQQLQANQQMVTQKNEQLHMSIEIQTLQHEAEIRERQLRRSNQELQSSEENTAALQQSIDQRDREVTQLRQTLASKNEEIEDLSTRMHQLALQDGRQLRRLNQELQSSQENTAALQQAIDQRDREVTELRPTLASKHEEIDDISTRTHQFALQDGRQAQATPIAIVKWGTQPDAPVDMGYGSSAVVGDKVYITSCESETRSVYEFSNNQWHKLQRCRNSKFTIVSVDNILTTVGGKSGTQSYSNKLYSYVTNKWVKHFPPMPTRRRGPGAVYANNTLVVAGGFYDTNWLTVVEIMNTANRQWSTVSSLPVPIEHPSSTICGDYVYIQPRTSFSDDEEKYSVYKFSLRQLTQSQPSSAIWEKISPLPVSNSSLVAINGHLLAVGGVDSNRDRSKDIYQYKTILWTVISQMSTPRYACLTAVLPGNKLMVAGGYDTQRKCEIATFV